MVRYLVRQVVVPRDTSKDIWWYFLSVGSKPMLAC